MGTREGSVTYEQVAATADALVAQGERATVRAIRALTSGSPNTILRHLQTWRSRQPVEAGAVRELPPAMVRAYYDEVARVAAEARAELEAQLVEAQTETADIVRAADELEKERDALLEQLATVTSERDALRGKAELQEEELDELREQLDREMRAAEDARISVAQERHAGESQRQLLEVTKAEVERLRAELRDEHDARIEAEREQARLVSSNSALRERVEDHRAQITRLAEERSALEGRLGELIAIERSAALENSRLSAQLEARGRHPEDWDRA